jgi:hypothetical protein
MIFALLKVSSHLCHIISQMSEKAGESDNDLFEVLSGYGDLDIEETDDDSTSTEGDISETSEDRRFVASGSDDATNSENESLESSIPCIHHAMDGHDTSSTVSVSMGLLWVVELTGATRSAKRYRLAPLPLA